MRDFYVVLELVAETDMNTEQTNLHGGVLRVNFSVSQLLLSVRAAQRRKQNIARLSLHELGLTKSKIQITGYG